MIQGTRRCLLHTIHQVIYVYGCIRRHLLLLEAIIGLLMRLLVPAIHCRTHIRVTVPCPMNLSVGGCLHILLLALILTLANLQTWPLTTAVGAPELAFGLLAGHSGF